MTDLVATERPLAGVRAHRARRLSAGRKLILAVVAYLIAIIFLLPYAEMVITAMRPPKELLSANYLPHHWDF
jgi:multiple sugar transport system permease protein